MGNRHLLTEIHEQALMTPFPITDTISVRHAMDDTEGKPSGTLNLPALKRVKQLLAANPAIRHPMAELERIAGMNRWTLARQFREAFGTSPRRYRTLCQLDRVRGDLRQGKTMTDAALDAGFADQSHMTRQFKLIYGLTPRQWLAANCLKV